VRNLTTHLCLLSALGVAFQSALTGDLAAQTFTTLYAFTGGSDGADPYAGVIVMGNALYGTTYDGGDFNLGAVFAVNTDGTGFTTLYSFSGGSDGAKPHARLVPSGDSLYGTATQGGNSGKGVVFMVKRDGSGFSTVYNFDGGSDGANPAAGLVLSGNTLYGTAKVAGASGYGTVFAVNTDGTGFRTLYTFTGGSDGAYPYNTLLLSGDTLYGTTLGTAFQYGNGSYGTVFKVNTNGTAFSTLHTFAPTSFSAPHVNSGGANPFAVSGLVLSGSTLYGTTPWGGSYGNGTVFAVGTDGGAFRVLHNFAAMNSSGINADGASPDAGLVLSGETLYGTTPGGGSGANGTLYKVNNDGTGFTTVYSFSAGSDGAQPYGGLVISGGTAFGTARGGGSSGFGTVFSISVPATPPELSITRVGANVMLTWPTNATRFYLQSTTNLPSALWVTNSASPSVVNGQYTLTNPVVGAQQFYRLSQ
jgi:uncharacterized repeat protein (TIGR03803 family)